MPAKSRAQYRFMSMIAHNKGMSGLHGISKKVAKEFIKKTSKKRRSLFSKR